MTQMQEKFWNQHMSEEIKHHGHDSEAQFEHQDMAPRSVYAFLIGLAVAGVLVAFVLWGMYHVLDAYQKKHQPPQNPLVQSAETDTRSLHPGEVKADIEKTFPQPRLETNERLEINDFRLKEEQTLNSYGFVDEKAGVVRIPVDRAMQLIAQRGLATTPKVGTVPPAETQSSEGKGKQ
jgi:hypothetical protein